VEHYHAERFHQGLGGQLIKRGHVAGLATASLPASAKRGCTSTAATDRQRPRQARGMDMAAG
jgi:hypothetical protein